MKKRPSRKIIFSMTLLELMVSLALASGLLTSIFYWIWSQNHLTQELNSLRSKIIQEEVLMVELQDSLGKVCKKPAVEKSDLSTGFYLEAGELHFYFKSGVHPKPELNLIQKGSIRLSEGTLILQTEPCKELWPIEKVETAREQRVLAREIQSIAFYFLYLPSVKPSTQHLKDPEDEANKLKEVKGLIQEATGLETELPLVTVIAVRNVKGVLCHFAIWREDGALVHALERSEL
jgi:hypothetical protein